MGLIGGLLLFIFCVYGIVLCNEVENEIYEGAIKKAAKKITQEDVDKLDEHLKKMWKYNNCLKNKDFIGAVSIGRQLYYKEQDMQTDILSHSNK